MKNDTRWIIVDTETDGLFAPIHVVEIAAQAMVGWEAQGEPFRIFLNHDVYIPPEATAVHGYTQEFLREHGISPTAAYALFREYVDGAPIVCHNLSYDWNRAMSPEWERLGIPTIGSAGFCTMLLSRRVIHETKRHTLDTLKAYFQIETGNSHHALIDVRTTEQLFSIVMAPRLRAAGIDTFGALQAFSRRTPVTRCLSQIRAAHG